MIYPNDFLHGIVFETTTQSLLGSWLYSDRRCDGEESEPHPFLNRWAQIPVLGRLAGLTRMALAIVHILGHLFCGLITWKKGHFSHALKGTCEFVKGWIELIPFVGYFFAQTYAKEGYYWMVKIYHPLNPDSLDVHNGYWHNLRHARSHAYVCLSS